jgi:hypothetical protein
MKMLKTHRIQTRVFRDFRALLPALDLLKNSPLLLRKKITQLPTHRSPPEGSASLSRLS